MSIVVVGSVALDSVKTPHGKREDSLGGSATYFSYAACFFTAVKLIGVVGEDFPKELVYLLKSRNIDSEGLTTIKGKTFRWAGSYVENLKEAKTLSTCLNVFETFRPKLPGSYLETDCVFLANIDPDLQHDVLAQVKKPKLIACDTMNLWISVKKESLLKLCPKVDIMIINDAESKQFTGEKNLVRAGRQIQSWGVKNVVIKKGEHGVIMLTQKGIHTVPAFPLDEVFDPTGAGDSFAGGFIGYLNKADNAMDEDTLHKALIYGTIIASFNVEKFSLEKLKEINNKDIENRAKEFQKIVSFKI